VTMNADHRARGATATATPTPPDPRAQDRDGSPDGATHRPGAARPRSPPPSRGANGSSRRTHPRTDRQASTRSGTTSANTARHHPRPTNGTLHALPTSCRGGHLGLVGGDARVTAQVPDRGAPVVGGGHGGYRQLRSLPARATLSGTPRRTAHRSVRTFVSVRPPRP
jgi:hypothetical protein